MRGPCARSASWTPARRTPCAAAVLLVLAVVGGCGDSGSGSPASSTAAQVERLRSNPSRLTEFLRRMPKGADLHAHLTGTPQTESLIDWGIEDDLCVDEASLTSSNPPCGDGMVPMRDAERDPDLYMAILAAWSMEGFVGPLLARHAHFFETFP